MGRTLKGLASLQNHDFKAYMKKERNPDVKIRLLGLSHMKEGKTAEETAIMLNFHGNSTRKWVEKFAKGGLKAIQNQPGKGAHKKIHRKYFPELKKGILELQKKRVGGRIRGKDIQIYVFNEWNVDYCLNSIYNLLKELNIVWISARSKNPVSSKTKQDAFKKNL